MVFLKFAELRSTSTSFMLKSTIHNVITAVAAIIIVVVIIITSSGGGA